ncbi:hypothetical protein HAX54_021533 [Datura stramonium]|uniref:Pentatricopeptide repeat-containing protein n=1 Tax=Datura stramonium TaxID=4076 RepID=A0ABS8S5S6_DATST|nr:hypothetical protein [Datura stramonium]
MLVSLYFRNREAKKALKIFHWVSRPDFPCLVDYGLCALLVNGFCKNDMAVEGLKVLRMMVFGNLKVGGEVRMWVYRSLLREARIREAQELNEAFKCAENGDKGNEEVAALLDREVENELKNGQIYSICMKVCDCTSELQAPLKLEFPLSSFHTKRRHHWLFLSSSHMGPLSVEVDMCDVNFSSQYPGAVGGIPGNSKSTVTVEIPIG